PVRQGVLLPRSTPCLAHHRQRAALAAAAQKGHAIRGGTQAGAPGCTGASQNQSTGTQEVAATAGHGGSPLADPHYQRQGAAGADLDGRPDTFPWRRYRRTVWPPLGNRAGLSGDEAQPATTPTDPA